ncbi:fimbrial protein [Pseudomonas aeruginosa]|nr:fimbrial protein [Pseudomonas aeruginosa]
MSAINVDLDPVSVSALDSDGKRASSKPFKISLTGCKAVKKAQMKFETYGFVDTETGHLKNSGSAKTSRSSWRLMTIRKSILLRRGSQVVNLTEGAADINLRASYIAIGGPAEPGSVNTTAIFSMKYE